MTRAKNKVFNNILFFYFFFNFLVVVGGAYFGGENFSGGEISKFLAGGRGLLPIPHCSEVPAQFAIS